MVKEDEGEGAVSLAVGKLLTKPRPLRRALTKTRRITASCFPVTQQQVVRVICRLMWDAIGHIETDQCDRSIVQPVVAALSPLVTIAWIVEIAEPARDGALGTGLIVA